MYDYCGVYDWYNNLSEETEKIIYVDRSSSDGFGISRALAEKHPVIYVVKTDIEKDKIPKIAVKIIEDI
jgi:hypothetical protein